MELGRHSTAVGGSVSPRVALVSPPAEYVRSIYGFHRGKSYRNQPPLGIGYLAACLRKHSFPVAIFDAPAEGWSVTETVDAVLAWHPAVVGISAISFEAESAYELARALRAQAPHLRLLFGGAHPTSHIDTVHLECSEFDAITAGEAEETLLALCNALAADELLADIAGARCRQPDGSFDTFRPRPPVHDLDTLPSPAYELFPNQRYRPLPHRRKRTPVAAMITSRGCSYARCTYCEMSALARATYRRHSPERVVEEMHEVVAVTGAREIYFQDDIFISEVEWVERFCDLLVRSRLDVRWSCESRFDGIPASLYHRMKRAGCWRIYFGLETADQELLDRIKKGFTVEQARQATRDVRAAGIEVVGFFMLGLPGETPALGRKTIELATQLGLSHAMFALTLPLRDTALYDICTAHGTILRERSYDSHRAAYLPHGYESAEQLEALRAEAYRRFYLRPGYWLQCAREIRSIGDLRYYADGVHGLLGFLDFRRGRR